MKACLVSLAAGLLVGLAYGIFGVRSPAPPVVALVGLLGILAGEQIAPFAKRAFAGRSVMHETASASDPTPRKDAGVDHRR